MPSPVIQARTDSTATNASSISINKPNNIQSGDLLLLACGCDDTSNSGPVWNTPSGWTAIDRDGDGVIDVHAGIFYRIADGTESQSQTISWSGSGGSDDAVAFYFRITGQHATSPICSDVNKTLGIAETQDDPPYGLPVSGITTDTGLNNNRDTLFLSFAVIDHGQFFPTIETSGNWEYDTVQTAPDPTNYASIAGFSYDLTNYWTRPANSSNTVSLAHTSYESTGQTTSDSVLWASRASSAVSDGVYACIIGINGAATASTVFQGKLGDLSISKMYLGDTEVTGAYLGDINLFS